MRSPVIAMGGTMPRSKVRKTGFGMLGYGVVVLYAFLLALVGLGVYGVNLSSVLTGESASERARAQVRHGRMLVPTADRTQCRSIRFNNETAELSGETLIECDSRPIASEFAPGASLGIFRDGFVNR